MITPEEFAEQMREISKENREDRHMDGDDLMCEILTDLGYGDGVEIFECMEKWYKRYD